ncbi:MAG TPA: indole-3-glycerol phosphate synthase TrpC [Phycisphaerae bacterium]|nr:indole-3-glycerol phosphate synthase TrpC [Phycisphaerae bacterium]
MPDDILSKILAVKCSEVADLADALDDFKAACRDAPPTRRLADVLRRAPDQPMRVVAEIKRRSPSAGVIADPFVPAEIASRYERGGADAISCLTDGEFFGGSVEHLREVRAAVRLPILRKDFLIAAVQVYEARAAGADAVLLIAEALDPRQMTDLAFLAADLGMDVLAEAHSDEPLEAAIGCGAVLVGINNRDLTTFEVRLETTECLAAVVRAAGHVLVSESGIASAADVRRLAAVGVDAVLVGESLLKSPDIPAKIAELKRG